MKFAIMTSSAMACLFFGTMMPVGAQGEAQSEKHTDKPQRTEQQVRAWQQQKGWFKPGAWQPQDTWPDSRAQRWSLDHRTWPERGGYGGYSIPPARFILDFGSQHSFRLASRPTMSLGYPRFEHGGYSFLLVDPFPEYWSDNWYEVNDLYIDYDDGYYLHNRGYTQVRLAIVVEL